MTPEEIRLGSWRIEALPPEVDRGMDVTLDTSKVLRDQVVVNLTTCQEEIHRWKNKKVKPCGIQTGDMVLRRVPKSQAENKLNAKWEGPFLESESTRPSAFRLQTLEAVDDQYSWNKDML